MKTYNPVMFKEPGSRLSGNYVTISSGGGFLFSSGVVHKENLTRHKYCVLSYDKKASAILLSFNSDSGRSENVTITHRKEGNSSIMCRSFFAYFNLDRTQLSGRYEIELHKIKGVDYFVINLDKKLPKRGDIHAKKS